jgi:hypothetical protein
MNHFPYHTKSLPTPLALTPKISYNNPTPSRRSTACVAFYALRQPIVGLGAQQFE